MQIDGIGPVKDSGKALSILTKHRNGAWYILRDTYSSDFPWGRVPVAPIE
jgi:ketosteroid isomerase-like protein